MYMIQKERERENYDRGRLEWGGVEGDREWEGKLGIMVVRMFAGKGMGVGLLNA